MKPVITLFKKEFRQHGAFALGMVFLCFLFQTTIYEFRRWNNSPDPIPAEVYYIIAFWMTILYAGAAAALAYSTEHAEKTFSFLRNLPISLLTIALGKIGWVLCGTLMVLCGTLIISSLWTAYQTFSVSTEIDKFCLTTGIGILEMIVWGLFWSTRFRSQVHALLATYFCATVTIFVVACCFSRSGDSASWYVVDVLSQRLTVIAVVGLFAIWGMLRWFRFESRDSRFFRFPEKIVLFRYPPKVQRPFLALIHQHLRHASILYPFGIVCFTVFSLGCLWLVFQLDYTARSALTNTWWWQFGTCISTTGIVLFWGTIFGSDQRHDSYRFLSRLGIHEGKIWWSRMLPAILLYIPVFLCLCAYSLTDQLLDNLQQYKGADNYQAVIIQKIYYTFLPMLLIVWFVPVAVGAFLSISRRSQVLSIVLIFAGTYFFSMWGTFFFIYFGCSPWWTTVPIVITVLIASRLRAGYWLRETVTWRSRLIPLAPMFGVILAIFIALPLVRIYSIPYVSWEQVTTYLDQTDLPDRLSPEKRQALLRFIIDGEDTPEYRFKERYEMSGTLFFCPKEAASDDDRQIMQRQLQYHKKNLEDSLSQEELIFEYYVSHRANLKRLDTVRYGDIYGLRHLSFVRTFLPWEMVRMERFHRINIVAGLASTSGLQNEHAQSLNKWIESRGELGIYGGLLDSEFEQSNGNVLFLNWWQRDQRLYRLHVVFAAINCYYWEHDQTLPELLDDLVGTYLEELPIDPLIGKPMEYYLRSSPSEEFLKNRTVYVAHLGLFPFPDGREKLYRTTPELRVSPLVEERRTDIFIILGGSGFAIFEPLETESQSSDNENE